MTTRLQGDTRQAGMPLEKEPQRANDDRGAVLARRQQESTHNA